MKFECENPRSPTMHNGGETLLEAIVAISIIVILIAPASGMYVSSIRTLGANKNDLVATAIAEEGLEVVENMRDTNLLRFSAKAKDCWNAKPVGTTLATCADPANKIAAGDYQLTLDPDSLTWDLVANNNYALRLDSGTSSLYFAPPAGLEDRGQSTIFSRKINISYGANNAMRVISSVKYQIGSLMKEVKRIEGLTNQPN